MNFIWNLVHLVFYHCFALLKSRIWIWSIKFRLCISLLHWNYSLSIIHPLCNIYCTYRTKCKINFRIIKFIFLLRMLRAHTKSFCFCIPYGYSPVSSSHLSQHHLFFINYNIITTKFIMNGDITFQTEVFLIVLTINMCIFTTHFAYFPVIFRFIINENFALNNVR